MYLGESCHNYNSEKRTIKYGKTENMDNEFSPIHLNRNRYVQWRIFLFPKKLMSKLILGDILSSRTNFTVYISENYSNF